MECGQKSAGKDKCYRPTKPYNMERNNNLTKTARSLRKNMTKEESKLWNLFLRRYQPRFHRQYVIGNYITDFYCHKAKLVVELDGSQHYSPEEMHHDQIRTAYLQAQGLKVLRFSNLDILQQFASVCEAIDMAVKESQA